MSAGGRETAGATTCLIVRYVREHGGEHAVEALIARAGVPYSAAELEDERRWFTYDEKVALFEAAAEVLDDADVTRHIGEAALDHRVAAATRVLLRALGSPRTVLANVARASPKFSTVARMDVVSLGRSEALITYELDAAKVPHRLDCLLNQGLLSVVGPLFGLPLLRIEHTECQVRGAPRCVYRVRWATRRRRGRHRTRHLEEQVSALASRLEALQSTVADLVSPDELPVVLGRIVARASSAIGATRFVLAVRGPAGGLEVHADGLDREHAMRVVDELVDLPTARDHDHWLVEDVASSGRRYGVIAASVEGFSFFDEERSLFAAYARLAAAVLDAASALHEARDRARANEALLELAGRLAEISTSREVAQRLAEAMPAVFGGEGSLVLLVEDGALRVAGRAGWSPDQERVLDAFAVDVGQEPVVSRWLATPVPDFLTGNSESAAGRYLLQSLAVEAIAAVPVRGRGTVLGIAGVGFRAGEMPAGRDALFERLTAVAGYAGVALDNASLMEQLRYRAMHDERTGLVNRACFEDQVEQALERAGRDRTPVTLLFVDLDGLKRANDRFGHHAGDDVLTAVAARLVTAARAGDVVARIGGDEFGLMLWNATLADAVMVAERIRRIVAEPIDDELDLGVTASVGIARALPGERYQDLLRRADLAMYEAKRAGGDRCMADQATVLTRADAAITGA